MKQCRECREWKDEEAFNWRYKTLGIRQPICRECDKKRRSKHYDSYKEEEVKRVAEGTRARREIAQKFIYEYLSHSRCVDCGEYDFSVLTFDHVRGEKKMDVSAMVGQGYALEAIQEEIAKCEVRCFNCHMRRTNERRSGGRFRKFWPKFPWEE